MNLGGCDSGNSMKGAIVDWDGDTALEYDYVADASHADAELLCPEVTVNRFNWLSSKNPQICTWMPGSSGSMVSCPAGTFVYHGGSHCCNVNKDNDGNLLTYASVTCKTSNTMCPGSNAVDGTCKNIHNFGAVANYDACVKLVSESSTNYESAIIASGGSGNCYGRVNTLALDSVPNDDYETCVINQVDGRDMTFNVKVDGRTITIKRTDDDVGLNAGNVGTWTFDLQFQCQWHRTPTMVLLPPATAQYWKLVVTGTGAMRPGFSGKNQESEPHVTDVQFFATRSREEERLWPCPELLDENEKFFTFDEDAAVTSYLPEQCVFPFTYNGKEYDKCAPSGDASYSWCSAANPYVSGGTQGVDWFRCPVVVQGIKPGSDLKVAVMQDNRFKTMTWQEHAADAESRGHRLLTIEEARTIFREEKGIDAAMKSSSFKYKEQWIPVEGGKWMLVGRPSVRWVWSESRGDSCDDTCTARGGTCDVAALTAGTTFSKFETEGAIAVSRLRCAGASCPCLDNCNNANHPSFWWDGMFCCSNQATSTAVPTCAAKENRATRLCPCKNESPSLGDLDDAHPFVSKNGKTSRVWKQFHVETGQYSGIYVEKYVQLDFPLAEYIGEIKIIQSSFNDKRNDVQVLGDPPTTYHIDFLRSDVSSFPLRWIWGNPSESCNDVCGRHASVCRRSSLITEETIKSTFWDTLPAADKARCADFSTGNGINHPSIGRGSDSTYGRCYFNSIDSTSLVSATCRSNPGPNWARMCPCFGPKKSDEAVETSNSGVIPSWRRLHMTDETWLEVREKKDKYFFEINFF